MGKEKKVDLKKTICFVAGLVAFIVFGWIAGCPKQLAAAAESVGSSGDLAMKVLASTIMVILWWVGEVFPDWVSTILLMVLWVVVGKIPFTTSFGSFAGTSVWLIVGAFVLAAALTNTGLFKRIALFLMQLFPPTFIGQVLALLIVGMICSPLIPSSTAKAVLGAGIALNVADAMGYGPRSSGRVGLFVASWAGFSLVAPAFLSGGVFNYTLYGLLSSEVQAQVTWTNWLIAMLPWLAVVIVGSFFGILVMNKPKQSGTMQKEYVKEECRKLGKMTLKEKEAGIILVIAVVFWILEKTIGVNSAITALGAAFLCFALKLLSPKEISTAVPWGLVIFLGGVLSMGTVFSNVGIDAWLQAGLEPVFSSMSSRVLIVLLLFAFVLVGRLFITSQSATLVIMMTILAPVAAKIGINPFIIGIIVYTTETCWFFSYQNVVFAPAFTVFKDTLDYKQTVASCAMYEVLSLVGCLISIPFWMILGYM